MQKRKEKKRKGMRVQTKRKDMRAEATITIHSCMSLDEQ
jgi:hypothetical protein